MTLSVTPGVSSATLALEIHKGRREVGGRRAASGSGLCFELDSVQPFFRLVPSIKYNP